MKSHLTKVSLAFVSALFILGCQDLGTSVEASDGLGPQFAKGGEKGKPDKPGGGGGGGEVAGFLTLTDGIATADLPVILSASYAAQNNNFIQNIVMNFGIDENTPYSSYDPESPESFFDQCEVIRGIDGVHHAIDIEPEYANLLLDELRATVKSGKFYMDIKATGLEFGVEATTDYYIDIQYDHVDGDAFILLGWGDGPTVTWVGQGETQDTFEFKGPIRVGIRGVTGEKGKKSNRTIACGGGVTLTLTW